MTENIKKLSELVLQAKKIVFFGGAGVSTESGVPDFRGAEGLFNKHPEELVSHSFFMQHPKEFYEFYRRYLIFPEVLPNITHQKLAEWEEKGNLLSIITQNIDGLHQIAGNKKVWELHGSVHRNFCMRCDKKYYGVSIILKNKEIPTCSCGGTIKPDVVLYQEGLDPNVTSAAIKDLIDADLLIIGGTSLRVYPAAGLIDYYKGKDTVLINQDKTGKEEQTTLFIQSQLGEVFQYL